MRQAASGRLFISMCERLLKSYREAIRFPVIRRPAIYATRVRLYIFTISVFLPALCESAAMADSTAPFVFHRASAFRTGSYEHCLAVTIAAVAVGLVALLSVFLERLGYRV